MWDDLEAVDPRFVYSGERGRYVAFPLGGIGSGGMSITGSGRLIDWSIRNRPAIHQFNGYSHFAIKAERDDGLVDARVLNGPYEGVPSGANSTRKFFDGFGMGANRNMLAGVPHFKDVRFVGRFPVADLLFSDGRFPGRVRMTAFSPFIPHNDRDSSLPVALFSFEIANDGDTALTYTLAGTLGNYGSGNGHHTYARDGKLSTLHLTSADTGLPLHAQGDLTLSTDAEDVDHMDYHFRGQWFDDLNVFWRDFARAGRLPQRRYEEPRTTPNMFRQPEHGTLGARMVVPAGESRTVRFSISWSFPHGDIYWFARDKPDGAPVEGPGNPTWKNYYATQWADSRASAADAFACWDQLAADTMAFRDGFFGASLPAEIKDAASATLALLRTATVIRLEGGELWGWEGQHVAEGSCEGSCTHVWNYQQALAYLFPVLERSLRETELTYNQLPTGGLTFRQRLPLGSGFDIIGPCADGHFGAVIKMYRDWKICGDTAWLNGYWPAVRRAMDYAWSDQNPDKWDPEQTGVLWGRQHHTLDMELFGPNSWLSSIYVAALRAAAEMAAAVGEAPFAEKCAAMARNGAAYLNAELFNGEYFFQKIDLTNRDEVARFDEGRAAGVLADGFMQTYWSDEHGQVKYQTTDGCVTDQILGQWHADLAGLGSFLDPEKVEKALASVFRNNFRPTLADHFNPCRVYAYEDEAGLLVMTWPDGREKPAVPAPYAEEVWTGLEYMSASHMIARGLVEEGLRIVRGARARHDGARRNPWNDIECGSYYARSMSAYALVNAWSGLRVDMTTGTLRFDPKGEADYRLFWSAGQAWGQIARQGKAITLSVGGGTLSLRTLDLAGVGAVTFDAPRVLAAGETLGFAVDAGALALVSAD